MRYIRLSVIVSAFALALVLGAAAGGSGSGVFTIEDVLSAPYPTELVAARNADRLAWVFNSEGARNVWTAAAPDYRPVCLTAYARDEVFELGDLSISEDGALVVYVRGGNPNSQGWVTNPTSDPAGVEQAVWAVRTSGGDPWRVCAGGAPVVSPDGRWVLIVKDGSIYRASLRDPSPSGETPAPQLLFKAAGKNGDPVWSPDGTRIAFVSNREEHSFVGVFDPGRNAIVWLAPSVDRDSDPAWSPDGRRVAFLRRPGAPYDEKIDPTNPPNAAIWVADAAAGRGSELWSPAGKKPDYYTVSNLVWAANGRILFTAEHDNWNHVFSMAPPAETAGAPIVGGEPAATGAGHSPAAGPVSGVTPGAATSAAEPVDLTPGVGEVEVFRASRDGGAIYFSSNHADIHGRHIWKAPTAPPTARATVPLAAATAPAAGNALPLTAGATIGCYPAPLANGKEVAFMSATARQPLSIALVPAVGGASRVIAPPQPPAKFPTDDLVVPELAIVKAPDGLEIPCQLFLPRGAKAGDRRPGVVFTHGGPMRQMLLGWHYMEFYAEAYGINQYFASRGFVVISVNYRSGIGYGRSFRVRTDAGRRGASEYQDLVAGAKYLQSRPEVDPGRVGLWGLSYGGLMTAMGLARNSDIFKAGVDLAGVHDWSAWSRGPNVTPEERKLAFDSSPVASVKTWTSPVLFIHGDDDRNVDFAQTVDLVAKLRAKGSVHIELMVRPDEPHEFLLRKNRLDAYNATFEFLARFLAKK